MVQHCEVWLSDRLCSILVEPFQIDGCVIDCNGLWIITASLNMVSGHESSHKTLQCIMHR